MLVDYNFKVTKMTSNLAVVVAAAQREQHVATVSQSANC